MFIDALSEDPAVRRFRLDDAIQRDVGSVQGLRGLDLLPSSLRLIDVQEKFAAMPLGQYYSMASQRRGALAEPRAESVLTHNHLACHLPAATARWSTITQIYEATSQVQRMVMARQLLK